MPHAFVHLTARLRWALHRHRWLRWMTIAGLAVGAAGVVNAQVTAARSARLAWGSPVEVAVARRPLAAGSSITRDDVEFAAVPHATLGPGALTEWRSGLTARHPIAAGEALLAGHLGAAATGELPPGHVGVAVAVARDTALPLVPGSRVNVIVIGDPQALDPGQPVDAGNVAAGGAPVLSVADQSVVIAVEAASAADIAPAAAAGRVVLVLSAGPVAGATTPSPVGSEFPLDEG